MRFVYCVWVLARTRTKFLSSTALPAPHGRQVGGCALFVRNSGRATLKQPWFILDSVCAACNANAERVSLRQKHWGKLRRLRNEFRHSHHVSLAKKYHSTRARHRVPRSGPLYLCRYLCTVHLHATNSSTRHKLQRSFEFGAWYLPARSTKQPSAMQDVGVVHPLVS
jgi:hypothetical protein